MFKVLVTSKQDQKKQDARRLLQEVLETLYLLFVQLANIEF